MPGLGKKSAMRILYYLLNGGNESIEPLQNALELIKERIERCPECRGYKEKGMACPVCSDPKRDKSLLCVVESTQDLHLIDSTSAFNGAYFVLHGLLSPFKGVVPDSLGMGDLKKVLEAGEIKEVIIATPYTAEGETTASYLITTAEEKGVKVSRIGLGIPIGSDLSFVDSETLSRALSGRKEVK